MRSPLRSKRAITSPVRARWKASGFTRISVRLTGGAPLGSSGWGSLFVLLRGGRLLFGLRAGGRAAFGALLAGLALFAFGALLGRGRALGARLAPALGRGVFPSWPLGQGALAVGTEGPARVYRLAAARTGVLETALTLRAAQEVLLDRVFAVGTGGLGQLAHPQLGGPDLQLPFVGVLEKLGGTHDRVDGSADVGKEGADRRAGDQEGVGDAALRVEVCVDDQRQPDDNDRQDEEGDGKVEAVVRDAEDR